MIKKIMILALALGVCSTAVAKVIRTKSRIHGFVSYQQGNTTAWHYYRTGEYVATMSTKCAVKISPKHAARIFNELEKEYKTQKSSKKHSMHAKKKAAVSGGYMPLPPSDMKMENGMGTESAQKTLIKMVRDVCLECGCQPEE